MGTLLHRVGEALSRKMAPFLLNCANSGELARCCLALGQYAVIGLAASAAICVEASADETETPAVGLAIRGFAEMSREAVGYLTQVIEPANYVVPPEGSTIDQLIQARCGDGTPAASQEILKKRLVELNAEVLQSHPLETPVSGGTKLNFPFCAPVYKNTTVPYYNNKAGLEGVIRSHYPVWGPVTQAKAIEQTEKCQDKSLEKCSRQLDDGDAILLPYSSPWVEGRIKSGLSPSEVAKKLESFTPEYKANTEENLTTTDAPLEYVGPLKASDLSPKDSCNTAPSADWPFDEALVRERLQKSEALAKTTNAPLRQAHIAIVDSGLGLDALKAIFTDKVLYLNKQEKENGVDDDQDQIADDLHGAGIQSDLSTSGDFYALSDADLEQFNHGTQVASLVLGGPKFLQEITASSEDSPLSISMLRASWRASPGVVHPAPPFLPVALTWVRSHGGEVLNLSLRHTEPQSTYYSMLYDRTLIVAAAGNKGADLQDAIDYPARSGGMSLAPVISVGAHGRNGQILSKSNYSKTRVDLLAPGCAIPMISAAGEQVDGSGTSYAAPLVSFTAGLLKHLGIDAPLEIRNRIISATDFDPLLNESVWSSGRLNIAKAISIFDDAVQLKPEPGEASGELIFGELTSGDDLARFCSPEERRSLAKKKIMKLNVYLDQKFNTRLRFLVDQTFNPERQLQPIECALDPRQTSLSIRVRKSTNDDQFETRTFVISDVADVVPRVSQ